MSFNKNKDIKEVTKHKSKNSIEAEEQNEPSDIGALKLKTYKKRWLILAIYFVCSLGSMSQSVEYGIIANIVARYYGVSSLFVEWTTMLNLICYVIFIWPVSYMINKYGSHWSLIVGSGLGLLSGVTKTFVHPDRFYLIVIGKIISAIQQTVILSLPGQITVQWFPSHEISTAISITVLSNQLGTACSLFIPSIIVKNHKNVDDIGNDLSRMGWIIVILNAVGFLLTLVLFQNEPKLPPSETRALQKMNQVKRNDKVFETFKRLLRNRNFIMHCNIYSLHMSLSSTQGALLNPIILEYFENVEDVGRIGFCMIFSGLFGGFTIGIILDKTHKYKESNAIAYFITFLSNILITIFLHLQIKWMVYVAVIVMGFFFIAYMVSGYNTSIEYTYPEPENISTGIVNIITDIYTSINIIICSILLKMYGYLPYSIGQSILYLLGFISTLLIKDDQRRQNTRKKIQFKELTRMIEKDNIGHLEICS